MRGAKGNGEKRKCISRGSLFMFLLITFIIMICNWKHLTSRISAKRNPKLDRRPLHICWCKLVEVTIKVICIFFDGCYCNARWRDVRITSNRMLCNIVDRLYCRKKSFHCTMILASGKSLNCESHNIPDHTKWRGKLLDEEDFSLVGFDILEDLQF